jgi:hypothetical protein
MTTQSFERFQESGITAPLAWFPAGESCGSQREMLEEEVPPIGNMYNEMKILWIFLI